MLPTTTLDPPCVRALRHHLWRHSARGAVPLGASAAPLPRLKVSENKRFLVTADGKPFFWLGDTAWELFHRLNREEAERYLKNRAAKGFTVIQAVALAELDGLHDAERLRPHCRSSDNDPDAARTRRTSSTSTASSSKANALGLYVGLLPTWGDKWNKKWGVGPEIFTPENAAAYGEWLGQALQGRGRSIWILGGDRPVENDDAQARSSARWRAGLRKGDGGAHLITFHPPGGQGSSTWFHDDDWLDFNMRQNGHVAEFTGRYDQTRADYDRTPIKPVLDGEPIYEDHPVSFKAKKLGHSIAADVRRPLYWDLFTGAFGHTYGHHSVWQMWAPGTRADQQPADALDRGDRPAGRGADAARPRADRVAAVPHAHPRRLVIVTDAVPTRVPGRRALPLRRHARRRRAATRWSMRRSAGRSPCGWTRSPGRR